MITNKHVQSGNKSESGVFQLNEHLQKDRSFIALIREVASELKGTYTILKK